MWNGLSENLKISVVIVSKRTIKERKKYGSIISIISLTEALNYHVVSRSRSWSWRSQPLKGERPARTANLSWPTDHLPPPCEEVIIENTGLLSA